MTPRARAATSLEPAPPAPSLVAAPYWQYVGELGKRLEQQGSLGLVLIDASQLARVERDYGARAFEQVRSATAELIRTLRGHGIRRDDVLTLDERGGEAFLVFPAPRRNGTPQSIADLEATAQRLESQLNQRLGELRTPYLPSRRRVTVGFALVLYNPLVLPERAVARLLDEAWECTRMRVRQRGFRNRCELQDVLIGGRLSTVFQPIVELTGAKVVGYEALTRGPEGSSLQMPLELFDVAGEADLAFELDRSCRERALSAARELPAGARLFVNVFPSCMYDPDFSGERLVKRLRQLRLTPERVVLEITERYAIEDYALFAAALKKFTAMGFSIAVDDLGAGYSGLEKLANLNPRYLKFDMQLVREIDASYVRREMARALKGFADRMGSTIIAEGIETRAELQTLSELGIRYGQGYLLGRPAPAFGAPRDTLAT